MASSFNFHFKTHPWITFISQYVLYSPAPSTDALLSNSNNSTTHLVNGTDLPRQALTIHWFLHIGLRSFAVGAIWLEPVLFFRQNIVSTSLMSHNSCYTGKPKSMPCLLLYLL
jgi:hypothetical protein